MTYVCLSDGTKVSAMSDEPVDSMDVDALRGPRDLLYVRDHLGSVRSVLDVSLGLVHPEVVERSDYLPFGTRVEPAGAPSLDESRWRFSGKEEQRLGGIDLGLLDFGARWYDPALCRWTTPDPLAAKYPGLSPYCYCGGDPVGRVDPDGNIWDTAWDIANVVMDVRSLASNVSKGNVAGAIVDGVSAMADVAAAIVPFIPGGTGMAVKAVRGVDATVDVARASDVVRVASKADDAAKAASATEAMRRGIVNEAKTLDALGETKNTKSFTVTLKDGTIKSTVPDINNATTIGEIKDVKKLSNTRQIQAEAKAAADEGKQFVIYTGKHTRVYGTVEKQYEIRRLDWLGPQK